VNHTTSTAQATLRWVATLIAACTLAAFSATSARAGTGLTELPATDTDGPVTVYYPSSAPDQPIARGPFTLNLALNGTPVRGNGRLVVISHGSGGSPWVHADTARTLVEAGFVVAMPEHRGDNYKSFTDPGPDSWKQRPGEVSRAIDAMAQNASFAALLAFDKVGVYGGSSGGHTALSFAGGRWSPAAFRQHCEANLADDFSSCVGFITRLRGNFLDGIKKAVALVVIRARFDDAAWYSTSDPRVVAAVASVPFAADFDMASLAEPRIALGLITAAQDVNQIPRFHSGAVLTACKTCEHVADLPTASHGVMLSPMVPAQVLSGVAKELLGDPPEFDRATIVPQVDSKIAQFMRRHLLP
jgi:predicted dienelactone hydrolase